MRLSSRRELYKLRELVHFMLAGEACFFCKKPLSETANTFAKHGESTGPRFVDRITVHHINGNHGDNTHDNKALCHTKCHRAHHRALANKVRASAKRMQEVEK